VELEGVHFVAAVHRRSEVDYFPFFIDRHELVEVIWNLSELILVLLPLLEFKFKPLHGFVVLFHFPFAFAISFSLLSVYPLIRYLHIFFTLFLLQCFLLLLLELVRVDNQSGPELS